MKRGVLIGLGVVLLLLGFGLAAAGAAVASLLGRSESMATAPTRIHSGGVALVAHDVSVDQGGVAVPSGLGHLTLTVSAPEGGAMFVGMASSAAVDRYLTGAPYDVVLDLAPGGTAHTRPVPGTQQPPSPDSQSFWTARASGAPATFSSPLSAGSTLVIMNTDATPGVTADVVATLSVPGAWRAAWVAVGAGSVLVLASVLAFWRARAARRRRLAEGYPTLVPASDLGILPMGAAPVDPPVEELELRPTDGPPELVDGDPVHAEPLVVDSTDEALVEPGSEATTAVASAPEAAAGSDPVYAALASSISPASEGVPAPEPPETPGDGPLSPG